MGRQAGRQVSRQVRGTSRQRDRTAGWPAGGQTIRGDKQAEGQEGMVLVGERQAEVQISSSKQ